MCCTPAAVSQTFTEEILLSFGSVFAPATTSHLTKAYFFWRCRFIKRRVTVTLILTLMLCYFLCNCCTFSKSFNTMRECLQTYKLRHILVMAFYSGRFFTCTHTI